MELYLRNLKFLDPSAFPQFHEHLIGTSSCCEMENSQIEHSTLGVTRFEPTIEHVNETAITRKIM